jgi:arylsulfatase A-like enzyme
MFFPRNTPTQDRFPCSAWLWISLSLLGCGWAVAADTAARPNVLFVAVDDLNDWTGSLGGHPGAITPNIDRLSGEGVRFARAYCTAPHCLPSRTSLLSGYLPSTSGVYSAGDNFRRALPNAVSLTRHFMDAGYRVMGAGKIFHDHDPASWHDYLGRSKDPGPPREKLPFNGIPGTSYFDWGPLDVDDSKMADGKTAAWAVEQLGKSYDRPFFLACGFYKPHLPWYVPRKYFDMHPLDKIVLPKINDRDLDDVPPMGRKFAIDGVGYTAVPNGGDHANLVKYGQWEKAVQGYLATCSFADAQVGRVLDALRASPHAKNTLVVLWSDHGWHLGEKLHWRKHALWEEATHCVIVFAGPGIGEGLRCDRPVSLVDLYPTLIDLCGLPARQDLDGRSLASLLRDPAATWERPALTTYGRNNHTLRSEEWRYIRYEDGTEELYDHKSDELEWTNLAKDPKYDKVKADLTRWLPKVNAPPVPRSSK